MVEDIVGVVLGLHVNQPVVGGGAVGVADSVGVFVGAEEVDVDALAVAVEGGEEASGPGDVSVGVVLAGASHAVEGDGVRRLSVPERGGGFRHAADGTSQVEHDRVRPW